MTTDQLEAFLAIVEFNSFHLAAEKLYLSQPTVTSRIQSLEREFNVKLFRKNGRGVELSREGIILVPYARRMINTYKQAAAKLESG